MLNVYTTARYPSRFICLMKGSLIALILNSLPCRSLVRLVLYFYYIRIVKEKRHPYLDAARRCFCFLYYLRKTDNPSHTKAIWAIPELGL